VSGEEEQAVLVQVALPAAATGWDVVERLGERLRERVGAAGVGEFDGDVVGEGEATLYLYGPDADRLWDAIADVVDLPSLPPGSHAEKRYGGPGARVVRVG
jgi:hypothetical protein